MEQFVLQLNRFDLGLLPEAAQDTVSSAFREAVDDYFRGRFREMGVNGEVRLTGDPLTVGWVAPDFDAVTAAIALCQRGQVRDRVQLLELARSRQPDSLVLLLNLGIGLNELGEGQRAVAVFEHLLDLEPDHVRGLAALARMAPPWTSSPGPSCSPQPTRGPSPASAACCCGSDARPRRC